MVKNNLHPVLKKILSLDKFSQEDTLHEILRYDFKMEVIENSGCKDSVTLMEEYKTGKGTEDCDRCNLTLEIYKELGWIIRACCDEDYVYAQTNIMQGNQRAFPNVRFDTINSFSTLYRCALAVYYPDEFEFVFNNNGALSVKECASYAYVSNNRIGALIDEYKVVEKALPYMQEFFQLTHSIGNFMIVPGYKQPYSNAKALCDEIKDFMDLFLLKLFTDGEEGKISYKQYNGEEFVVYDCVKNKWRDWLKENIELLCLQDYFQMKNVDIKPLPLYEGHSFKCTLPTSKETLKECIEEINKRIKVRGLRMIMKINNKVEQICKKMIDSFVY